MSLGNTMTWCIRVFYG
uniref:Uncharacterized protein n=1 Tax=Rhizophora mucronata TaxID=61149 RepID=A0A2P2QEI4_RHIMU